MLIARERARYAPTSTRLPDGVPAMSLEQFAWLSATLRATPPQDLAAVLASVRLTETTRAQLEAHWHARFEADPALRQAFLPLLAKHSAKGGS